MTHSAFKTCQKCREIGYITELILQFQEPGLGKQMPDHLDFFQHPSPFLKPISTLRVFTLGALLSGPYHERRFINLEIQYEMHFPMISCGIEPYDTIRYGM